MAKQIQVGSKVTALGMEGTVKALKNGQASVELTEGDGKVLTRNIPLKLIDSVDGEADEQGEGADTTAAEPTTDAAHKKVYRVDREAASIPADVAAPKTKKAKAPKAATPEAPSAPVAGQYTAPQDEQGEGADTTAAEPTTDAAHKKVYRIVDDEVSALLGSLFGKDATKEGFMAAVKAHPMFPHLNQKKVQHALDQFGVINNGLIRMRIGNMLRAAIQNVPLTAEKAADKAERAAKAEAAKLAKAEAKAKAREERKAALAAEKAEADALAAKETENAAS